MNVRTIKYQVELDKRIYDYAKLKGIELDKEINSYLLRKFKLGKDYSKPSPVYPMRDSIEIALRGVDVHDMAALNNVANLIMSMYSNVSRDKVWNIIGDVIKRTHRYDRFI